MILETVRIVAEWLDDPTVGVNAVRTTVPKDAGVASFPAVTVLDSTRDGRVARGGVPNLEASEFPCLLVTPADQPVEQSGATIRPWPPDGTVTVLVRYATQDTDTASAERNASQTIRAVWWAIGRLILNGRATTLPSQSVGENACARAGVQLIGVRSLQAATLYESTEDGTVTGGVLVTCHVRDTWAQS